MIVLDTNVISELMRDRPEPQVVRWLDSQARSSVWTTSIAIFESRTGILALPAGKRQASLLRALDDLLQFKIEERIAAFDTASALRSAELEALGIRQGRPRDARDTMIAGIVLANNATLATRNVKHFEDIAKSVVNPWE